MGESNERRKASRFSLKKPASKRVPFGGMPQRIGPELSTPERFAA
jgi:hypothetical protein